MRLTAVAGLALLCLAALTGCAHSKANGAVRQAETDSAATVFDELAEDMVLVEGGTFVMGDAENTAHSVTLSDFRICRHEVSQALWTAVMGTNPAEMQGDSLPVENVSWDDCQTFISRLNSLTGKHYRLPTEAEWEYACRGGKLSKDYAYSGSNDIDAVAWYDADSNSTTHPAGRKNPNELGLYDMSGNVWEWCQDYFAPYPASPQTNPTGPREGSSRVCRGGSWIQSARYCRPTLRNDAPPSFTISSQGLRLAL